MKTVISFSNKKIEANNFDRDDVFDIVREMFEKYKLPCVVDKDNTLVFIGKGDENDFSYMWSCICPLMQEKWFTDCADSCLFYLYDDEEPEDVLAQAYKVKR